VCCLKRDELQLLKIFSANQVAILCSVDLIYFFRLLNCITGTVEVTEGRILGSSGLEDGDVFCFRLIFLTMLVRRAVTWFASS